ncbi:MAG: hypothetical protein QOD50_86, partial [Actinomycetota bacterium]|nr:hypothetical protein [Actinomycetota bacterium]
MTPTPEPLSGLPLATSSWDDREYAALNAVIAAGRFTMGPLVAQFEQDFAAAFGS